MERKFNTEDENKNVEEEKNNSKDNTNQYKIIMNLIIIDDYEVIIQILRI